MTEHNLSIKETRTLRVVHNCFIIAHSSCSAPSRKHICVPSLSRGILVLLLQRVSDVPYVGPSNFGTKQAPTISICPFHQNTWLQSSLPVQMRIGKIAVRRENCKCCALPIISVYLLHRAPDVQYVHQINFGTNLASTIAI